MTRHAARGSSKLRDACSNTCFTCTIDTPGNHSRNSSTVAPPSRFKNSAETGTRVPRKTQAPLSLSGCRSTAGQVVQSSIGSSHPLSQPPTSNASILPVNCDIRTIRADIVVEITIPLPATSRYGSTCQHELSQRFPQNQSQAMSLTAQRKERAWFRALMPLL